MWTTATERQLLRVGVVVRVALLALAMLAQTTMMQWGQIATTQPPHSQPSASSTTMLSHYDASAQLLLQRSAWSRCPQLQSTGGVERALLHALSFQSHWDGIHFFDTAERGGYALEKESAFFPALPMLLRGGAQVIQRASSLLGHSLCPYTSLLLSAFLLSQACFFLSVVLLHRLSLGVLRSPRLAFLACVCFVCSPAAVFHLAAYSEGLFTTCSLAGMLARQHRRPALLVAALFAAATAARANGWVLAGFFAFDALHDSARLLRNKNGASLAGCFLRVVGVWAKAAVCAGVVVLPYALFQLHLASRFCSSTPLSGAVLPPYCASALPHVYAHLQATYWNVGFFRYYELRQLPNFLLALPVWTLSAVGIWQSARSDLTRFLSLGLWSSPSPTTAAAAGVRRARDTDPAPAPASLVYTYLWAGLFAICVTVLHVQVSTRFLSTCPSLYWFAAQCVHSAQQEQQQQLLHEGRAALAAVAQVKDRSGTVAAAASSSCSSSSSSNLLASLGRWLPRWALLYAVLGCALFSTFLPWT